ncbi:MAG: radical SAM protein [Methanomicrobiales archaeon]|nr:radical SAM protein [Methanomicrobiales archaeon]
MATLSERQCRSALVRSRIPGADYCINPYGGCGHGCVYCYAAFMKRFLRTAEPWGSFVQARTNIADRLAREIAGGRREGRVLLSSVTDPYQPAEQQYRLTRACLERLSRTRMPVSILTKSDGVLRDLDVLRGMADVEVGFSITTADDDLARLLEPGASPPSRRFHALSALAAAGIRTWVFISPVIPGIGDSDESLSAILARAERAGVGCVDYDPLNCYPSAIAALRSLIQCCRPGKLAELEAACADPQRFAHRIASRARILWPRYRFIPPDRAGA